MLTGVEGKIWDTASTPLHILRKCTANLSLFCQSLQACQSHPRSAPAVSQRWCIHKYQSPAKKSANHVLKKKNLYGGIVVLLTMLKHMPAISQSFLLKNLKTKKVSLDHLPLERMEDFSHLCILDLSLFLFSAFLMKCMFTWISL